MSAERTLNISTLQKQAHYALKQLGYTNLHLETDALKKYIIELEKWALPVIIAELKDQKLAKQNNIHVITGETL